MSSRTPCVVDGQIGQSAEIWGSAVIVKLWSPWLGPGKRASRQEKRELHDVLCNGYMQMDIKIVEPLKLYMPITTSHTTSCRPDK